MKKKIFVTTGSSLEFDSLVKEIDKINKNKIYNISCQIGSGKYIPKNCKYYRFKGSLEKDISWADLIITHTGAGTLFELLEKGKTIISVQNIKGVEGIFDLPLYLNKNKHIKYVSNKDISNLANIIKQLLDVKLNKFKKYKKEKQEIGYEIKKFILK